jgi:hypothetical protein
MLLPSLPGRSLQDARFYLFTDPGAQAVRLTS